MLEKRETSKGINAPKHRSIASKTITVRTSVKSNHVRVTIMRDPDGETIEYLLPIIFSDNIRDNKVTQVTKDDIAVSREPTSDESSETDSEDDESQDDSQELTKESEDTSDD